MHGRQLAGLVGRQDQLRHQLDAPVPLGGVQQVFQGQRRGSVGLIPVGGSQVQLRDDVGLDPTKLTEQELPEQRVVAIPPAPTVQRDQEQARRLQVAKPRLRTRLVENRVAQRSRQLIENRRAPQEPLNTLRQLHQRLPVQVVGHVPIITGDRQHVAVGCRCAITAARYRPTGHPSVRAVTAAASSCSDGPRGPAAKICSAPARVEGQVAGRELHRVARSPQPRQVRLLGTTRRHQLRALQVSPRSPRSAHRDRPGTGARAGRRASARTEPGWSGTPRPGAARPGPKPTRQARARRRSDPVWPEIRAYAAANTDSSADGIVVEAVQRHPPDPSILRLGPFGQQGRLAVTRRRGDTDHPAIARASRLDQVRRDSPNLGDGRGTDKLRIEQHRLQLDDARRRPAPILGHQPDPNWDRLLGDSTLRPLQPDAGPVLRTTVAPAVGRARFTRSE